MNGYNFSERVRKILTLTREEAGRLRHESIAPEHILLGLIREGGGVATAVMQNLRVNVGAVQREVEASLAQGTAPLARTPGTLPYTARAKELLERTMQQARALKHSYIGTEHLLLALVGEDGTVGRVLAAHGLNAANATTEVRRVLGPERPS